MNLPTSRVLEVLTALLLLSGCTRRLPDSGIYETRCRTLGVRFEQTAGACTPFSQAARAVELLGERCNDATLERGLRELQEESGPERVEAVLRGERVPGSGRYRVVVRYASSTPGSCPLDHRADAASCDDCRVGKIVVAISPSNSASEPLKERVLEVVKEGLRTCKAEELDAARARVGKVGNFDSVEVLCTRDTDDGLRRVLVNVVQPSQRGQSASSGGGWTPPPRQLTCSKGVRCSQSVGGNQECDCR
jgi:hypothetical protein